MLRGLRRRPRLHVAVPWARGLPRLPAPVRPVHAGVGLSLLWVLEAVAPCGFPETPRRQ